MFEKATADGKDLEFEMHPYIYGRIYDAYW